LLRATIRRRPAERRPCAATAPAVFYLTRGDLPGEVNVERILANLEAINRACAEAKPFIYVLHSNRIERMAL